MEEIYKKARAKVNLTLSILEKREDGYHNLESVFQKINLYDEIMVKKIDTQKIELETDIKNISLEENIIYKAYNKLLERKLIDKGVKVTLKKNIPMQAGLAGGSTDCACFLLAMKEIFKIDEKVIIEIGSELGADVVPCMYNGAVKAEGIGDKITKINTTLKYYFVIIKPNCACSTKFMYDKLDSKTQKYKRLTSNAVLALEANNFEKLSQSLVNDFELAVEDIPEIIKAKFDLQKAGAKYTLLAGSGACVFGIFKTKELAKQTYYKLKEKYETYICSSCNCRRKK